MVSLYPLDPGEKLANWLMRL